MDESVIEDQRRNTAVPFLSTMYYPMYLLQTIKHLIAHRGKYRIIITYRLDLISLLIYSARNKVFTSHYNLVLIMSVGTQ